MGRYFNPATEIKIRYVGGRKLIRRKTYEDFVSQLKAGEVLAFFADRGIFKFCCLIPDKDEFNECYDQKADFVDFSLWAMPSDELFL